jgi:hypothetical protein
MPTYTFLPRKKGSPQSKKPDNSDGVGPPMLENTLFEEAVAIWNGTTPLGEPPEPVVVADRVRVDGGQYQSPHVWIALSGKKRPLEPESIKLS